MIQTLYKNTNNTNTIDIVIDIDIDILVNFVRFQRTEIYGGGASLLPTDSKIELKILIIFCII
jgi:hypothetical protein